MNANPQHILAAAVFLQAAVTAARLALQSNRLAAIEDAAEVLTLASRFSPTLANADVGRVELWTDPRCTEFLEGPLKEAEALRTEVHTWLHAVPRPA